MKKVLLLVGAALVMSACGQAPTAPDAVKRTPSAQSSHDDIFCESGYVIAYDENGNPICVPDPNGGGTNNMSTSGGISGTSGPPRSVGPAGGQ